MMKCLAPDATGRYLCPLVTNHIGPHRFPDLIEDDEEIVDDEEVVFVQDDEDDEEEEDEEAATIAGPGGLLTPLTESLIRNQLASVAEFSLEKFYETVRPFGIKPGRGKTISRIINQVIDVIKSGKEFEIEKPEVVTVTHYANHHVPVNIDYVRIDEIRLKDVLGLTIRLEVYRAKKQHLNSFMFLYGQDGQEFVLSIKAKDAHRLGQLLLDL